MDSKITIWLILLLGVTTGFASTDVVHREFTVGSRPCLVLEADPAHLVVESGDTGRIVVDVKLPKNDIYTVSIVHDPDKVTVRLIPKGTLGLLMHNLKLYEVDVRVRVPSDCDVVLITRKGELEVSGVGEIRSRSSSPLGQIIKWVFRIGA